MVFDEGLDGGQELVVGHRVRAWDAREDDSTRLHANSFSNVGLSHPMIATAVQDETDEPEAFDGFARGFGEMLEDAAGFHVPRDEHDGTDAYAGLAVGSQPLEEFVVEAVQLKLPLDERGDLGVGGSGGHDVLGDGTEVMHGDGDSS